MNHPHSDPLRSGFCALLACAAISLSAAAAATAPVETKPTEETLVLSPFTVDATRDQGFVAASALAGGRLSTELRNTPAAYSVLTRDFIDALSLTNLTNAQQWTTGFNLIEDDGRQNQFGSGEAGRRTFRGVASNQQMIEFFPAFYDYDSYNLERFDFARGPNSILFGSGSMGGTANGLYKRARVDKAFRELRLGVGSWNNDRATFDIHQPLTKQLALRANVLWEATETWRDHEYFDRMAATITGSYRPRKDGELRVTADKGEYHRNASLTTLGDRISGWDGTTTYSGRLAALPADANARGITRFGTNQFIYSPGVANNAIVNWDGFAFTQGGNAATNVPIGGQLVVGPTAGYADAPILGSINRPANAFDRAIAGSTFRVPTRQFTTTHDGDTWRSYFENYIASFDQKVGEHLFLGVSGNYSEAMNKTDYTVVRGLNNAYIDINQTLPTGVANPNFRKPYSQSTRDYDEVFRHAYNGRANAAVVFNDTRFGDYRLNLEYGVNNNLFRREKYRYMVKDPSVPSRDWINQIIQYRYYWDGPLTFPDFGTATVANPITGTTSQVPVAMVMDIGRPGETVRTKNDFNYSQAAVSATFWKKRINLLGAVRQDDYESITDQVLLRGDYGTAWNGTERIYRPRPPEDYLSLPATRPRVGGTANGVRDAAFANQRYQDDYSLPTISGKITTYSAGGVAHLFRGLSAFYNYAETWTPPSQDLRISGARFLPVTSDGWDSGLRLELLNNRVFISATHYQTNQDNLAVGTGTGTGGLSTSLPNAINAIVNANVIGDTSATGQNRRGLTLVPSNYSDTARRKSKGTELEVVANLTPQWRLLANLVWQNAVQGDGYADTRSYLAANDATLRQALADAGVTVAADGTASATRTDRSIDADGAANAYNELRRAAVNLTPVDQKVARLAERTANLFTDYTVREGLLKNVRFGGGVNYRGKEVIGYRGGERLASGALDPNATATVPVYRDPYYLVTAVLGYSFKAMNRYPVRLDLTVNNLLDNDDLLYYNTTLRPPGGDVTSQARVAVGSQYQYLTPRQFSLTATFSF
jgi:outer membrane receptor protein involved in Fe transport